MYASLKGGIDSLFDEGYYWSQITSVDSVYLSLHKRSQIYAKTWQGKKKFKNLIEAHLYSGRGLFYLRKQLIFSGFVCIIEISEQPEKTFDYKNMWHSVGEWERRSLLYFSFYISWSFLRER